MRGVRRTSGSRGATRRVVVCLWLGLATIGPLRAQQPSETFAPLQQWRAAVLAGDAAALKAFYSTNPPVLVYANGVQGDRTLDETFWSDAKPTALNIATIASQVRHGMQQVIFSAAVTCSDGRSLTITDQQSWQKQGEDWRMVSVVRTDGPVLKQPSSMNKDIYPASAD